MATDRFDQTCADLRRPLPEQGIWEQPGSKGIGFQLTEPGDSSVWKTYFGVQAGYLRGDVYSVSILPQAIHWGGEALERLRESVVLRDWPHGGYAFSFESAEEWDKVRSAALQFVNAVMANRTGTDVTGPDRGHQRLTRPGFTLMAPCPSPSYFASTVLELSGWRPTD